MPQFHEEQTDFNGTNAILKTSNQYYSPILVPFFFKFILHVTVVHKKYFKKNTRDKTEE